MIAMPEDTETPIAPPFPWFGGKARVAGIVWQRFGDAPNYVEPFAGSLAVLLRRPHPPGIETVNDLDCYLANFWRAVAAEPEAVAAHADWPVNEADLHARHRWLLDRAEFRRRMHSEPDYYDAKIAGWWVWGQCQWIGGGWCDSRCYVDGGERQTRPHLGPGRGIHRPSQKLPHLGDAGQGDVYDYMRWLAARLRRVRVCCGDWSRVCGPTPTFKLGVTGVFLDPPYMETRDAGCYAVDDQTVAADVAAWARDNGEHHLLRIALCGYEGEHDMPADWECVEWKAHGGYANRSNARGRDNAHRERIWFSPHCLRPDRTIQRGLFDEVETP